MDHCMVIDNDRRLMVCGGSVTPYRFKSDRECLILDGTWKFHSYLASPHRKGAIGITMPNGIYILGGWNSPMTSEFLAKGSSTWIIGPDIPVGLKCLPLNCKYYRYGEALSNEEFIIITVFMDRGITTKRVFSINKFNVITQEWTHTEVKLGLGESCRNVFSNICPNSILRPTMDKFLPGVRGDKVLQIGVINVKGVVKVLAFRDKNLAKEWENANQDWKPILEPIYGRTLTGFCSLLNTKLEDMPLPSTLLENLNIENVAIPVLPKRKKVFKIFRRVP